MGVFLAQLWQATREQRFLDYAPAGRRGGLADALDDGDYGLPWACRPRRVAAGPGRGGDRPTATHHCCCRATEVAELIALRSAIRQGRQVPADERGTEVSAGFNTGLAGVLSFLVRLRYGGPRLWIADSRTTAPATG